MNTFDERDHADVAARLNDAANLMIPEPAFLAALEADLMARHPARRAAPPRWLLAAAVILTLAGALLIASPPVRALAQEMFSRWFAQGDDDAGELQIVKMPEHRPEGEPFAPGETLPAASAIPTTAPGDPPVLPGSFAAQVPFEVWLPSYMPPNYALDDVEYHPVGPATYLEFKCEAGFWAYAIWQRQMTPDQLAVEMDAIRGEVGASAVIEQVPVREVIAEYVVGDWRLIATPDLDNMETGVAVSANAEWDSTIPFHRLMWYEDGFLFRIWTSAGTGLPNAPMGDCPMTRDDFIRIAHSMR